MDAKVCDICGKSPANRIEVGISMYGVAIEGQPTGSSEGLDACEACQEAAIDKLVVHIRETLREQVPKHAELLGPGGIQERLDAATTALLETDRLVKSHADAGADVPQEIADSHTENLNAVAELEADRRAVLVEGTQLADKRVAAFAKSLKKRVK